VSARRRTFAALWPMLRWIPIFGIATTAGLGQCRSDQRPVTVSDAIEMTEVVLPELRAGANREAAALFSPDGARFSVVLRRGDLSNNTNVDTLLVFSTQIALHSRKPETILKMSSNSNQPGIAGLRWLTNGHTLVFLGEEPDSPAEVYSFDILTNRLLKLTAHRTSVVSYSVSDDAHVIVFEADPPPRDLVDTPATRRSGFVISGQDLSSVLFAGYRSAEVMRSISRELFVQRGLNTPVKIAIDSGLWPSLPISVAPDGRFALLEGFVRHVPAEWALYKERLLHEFVTSRKEPDDLSTVESYLLLDTRSGRISPLLNAPKAWRHDGVLWLHGGRSLVVSQSYLPLDGTTSQEKESREQQPFVIELDPASGRFAKIGSKPLTAVRWNEPGELVSLYGGGDNKNVQEAYRKRGASWEEVPWDASSVKENQTTVMVMQDLNAPPTIWIFDSSAHEKRLLLNPNPQFSRLCFSQERKISWKTPDGRSIEGGLYLPPGYLPGKHYPLVIQTHAFDPQQFWIDGPWHSAFAAQPLAASGIVVLQMGYDSVGRSTPEEGPRTMSAFESAIDYLSGESIIDPNHVGIIGFSRTVYHVGYALTHSNHHFAAATLADGFDGGYFQALAFPISEADTEAVNGGPPYGPGLAKWLEASPLFKVDSVATPIRLESYGMDSVLGLWGWYSLLFRRDVPVDFVLLPHAPHLLVKPWERLVSQQGNVDWFTFWLQGKEDPSPDKAAQYIRWRQFGPLAKGGFAKDAPVPAQ
jgi:hypothetical protein